MTGLGQAIPPHFADFLPIWPQIVYLFIFVSAVSIITWNMAVRLVGAQTATLVSTFTPVIPFTWAAYGGRVFTYWEIVGVVVIMVAILTHNLNEQRKARAMASA